MGCCSNGQFETLPQSPAFSIPEIHEFVSETLRACYEIRAAHNGLFTAMKDFERAVTHKPSFTIVTAVLVLLLALLCKSKGDIQSLGVAVTEHEPFLSYPSIKVEASLLHAIEFFRSLVRKWSGSQSKLTSFLTQRENLDKKTFMQACDMIIERSNACPKAVSQAMGFVRTRTKIVQDTFEYLTAFESHVTRLSLQLPKSIQLFYVHQDALIAIAKAHTGLLSLPMLAVQYGDTLSRLSLPE